MADEDKEKAEKLAAAKKRFEQLKKEQQKKGKKGAGKKKGDKTAAAVAKDDETQAAGADTENDNDAQATGETENPDETHAETTEETAATEPNNTVADDDATETVGDVLPSLSVASKQRSESFRQGVTSPGAGPEVQELYRKQAARIEEVENELKAAKEQREADAARLAKSEEELESLREGSSDMAELKSKASQVERLEFELATTQRELMQAQQNAKANPRRASGTSADLAKQLESKTSSIESLELELSNLRNELKTTQATLAERDASVKELEARAESAETAADSHKEQLEALKASMPSSQDAKSASNQEPQVLATRIAVLESDLKTADTSLQAANQRATSLEQKIEALTKLHRDTTTAAQGKEKELAELREQLKKRDRPSHVRDASEFELGEEETETGALEARIRALEAENFELRRGVWRDKRAQLQPGMEEAEYEDVDLNGPSSPFGHRGSGAPGRQTSSFQDVITSGINAFTGRQREGGPVTPSHARDQSLGLLDDDDGFDEDAFRLAQEEEAKRRIERVKEIKRGLDDWKGWRVDLADIRQQGLGPGRDCGVVFEV